MLLLEMSIAGAPRPQGSMQLSRDPRNGHEFAKYSEQTVNHRNYVIDCIARQWKGSRHQGPVALDAQFLFVRPKSHFGTGKNAAVLKPTAPKYMSNAPDCDKCLRLIGDALTIAGVIEDDKLIALMRGTKKYADTAGTMLRVFSL